MATAVKKVLVIDDEKKILTVAKKLLARENYELLTSTDPEEAFEVIDNKGPIAVVVSDNRMPTMRGTEFFKKLKSTCPETVRILMTANYDAQLIEDVVNTGEVYRFLKKPLDFKVVQQTIQAGIEQYDVNMEVKAKEEKFGKLTSEKSELENKAEDLDGQIQKLSKVKKQLVFTILMVILSFGLFQGYSAWTKTVKMEATGEKMGRWMKYANGTALDEKTNLVWMTEDFRNIERRQPNGWNDAMAWVEKMNKQRYGGYTDWRVPTIEEYESTFDPEGKRMAYDFKKDYPVGYAPAFEDGGGYGYWSNEVVGLNSAKYFFFLGGYSKTNLKTYNNATLSIRLVRN